MRCFIHISPPSHSGSCYDRGDRVWTNRLDFLRRGCASLPPPPCSVTSPLAYISGRSRALPRQMETVGSGGRIITHTSNRWTTGERDIYSSSGLCTNCLVASHRLPSFKWIPAVSPRRSASRATPWMRIYLSLLRSVEPRSRLPRGEPGGTDPTRANRSWLRWWRTPRRGGHTVKGSSWERYGL